MSSSGLVHLARTSSLVEREAELGALEDALEDCRRGRGRVVFLEGLPGIGKTSLLEAAQRLAHERGMTVLRARGGELERDFPFCVVRQLFEREIGGPGETRPELVRGPAAHALPALRDVAFAARPFDPTTSYTTLHGLFWLTVSIAERNPTVISIDDGHWSDQASLQWLCYLAKRIDDLPVLAVVAARPASAEPQRSALAEAAAGPAVQRLRPAPLSEAAVATLVRLALSEQAVPEFCAACHSATGGNPFLLRELLTELRAAQVSPSAAEATRIPAVAPRTVCDAVLRRLAALPSEALPVARAMAVLGDGSELRHIAHLAAVEESVAGRAAGALAHVDVLREGEPFAFVHPIVRAAIYSDIAADERADAHRRAARVLQEDGAPASRVALHLLSANPSGDSRIVHVLREAAAAARDSGAPKEAAAYLRRALAEPPPHELRAELTFELGTLEVHGSGERGLERLRQALRLTTDPVMRARVSLELGRGLAMVADSPSAVAVLDAALTELGGRDPVLASALETELVCEAIADRSMHDMVAERLPRLQAAVRDRRTRDPLLGATMAARSVASGEDVKEAAAVAERILEASDLPGAQGSRVLWHAANALAWIDRLGLCAQLSEDASREARCRASLPLLATASCLRADVAFRRGAVADAQADAERALEAVREAGWGKTALAYPLAALADPLVERGAADVAARLIDESGLSGALPELWPFTRLLAARAVVRSAQGRMHQAIADLRECGRRALEWRVINPAVVPWRSQLALALAATGERDEARSIAAEELALADQLGLRRGRGMARRALALVEGGEAEAEGLREAVAMLERSGARLELARALVDLGFALRRRGRRVESREALRRGLELADRCGASALRDRAQEELVASGARPRRAAVTGLASLTGSEFRVVRLAAGGMTNREIAAALFVTEKTVETHLTSSYRKLMVRSRAELTRAIGAELSGGGPAVGSDGAPSGSAALPNEAA